MSRSFMKSKEFVGKWPYFAAGKNSGESAISKSIIIHYNSLFFLKIAGLSGVKKRWLGKEIKKGRPDFQSALYHKL